MEQGQWGPPQRGTPGLNATLGFKVWFSWSRGSGAHLKEGAAQRGLNATLGSKVVLVFMEQGQWGPPRQGQPKEAECGDAGV